MFGKTRPVPSSAALKVLHQLAYISSGTAIGAAALCAEERRRRTLIVQKIADNARRIRQSPKYVHNKATSAIKRAENAVEHGMVNAHAPDEAGKDTEDGPDEAMEAIEIPSAVDHGNQQINQKEHEPMMQYKTMDPDLSGSDKHSYRKSLSSQRSNSDCPRASFSECSPGFKIRKISGRYTDEIPGPWTPEFVAGPRVRRRLNSRQPSNNATNGNKHRIGDRDLSNDFRKFELQSQALSGDIRSFLERVHRSTDGGDAVRVHPECEVATDLLLRALIYGSLSEIRSLCSWLASRDQLTGRMMLRICESCRRRAHGHKLDSLEHVFQFYQDLFFNMNVSPCTDLERVKSLHAVISDLVAWDVHVDTRLACAQAFYQDLIRLCKKALVEKDFVQARMIIEDPTIQFSQIGADSYAFDQMINDLIWHSLRLGDHTIPLSLLELKLTRSPNTSAVVLDDPEFIPQLEHLAGLGLDSKPSAKLLSLLLRLSQDCAWINSIDDRTKIRLIDICSPMKPSLGKLFQNLYEALPTSLRTSVDDPSAVHRLRQLWRTTRDLNAVTRLFESLRSKMQGDGSAVEEIALMEMSVVDICISAGAADRALKFLSSIKGNPAGVGNWISHAAKILAIKEDWSQLKKLVEVSIKGAVVFPDDPEVTRRMNGVFRLYSRNYGVINTWNFVDSMIKQLALRPDKSTVKIVLCRCVTALRVGRPSLIEACIKYFGSLRVGVPGRELAVAAITQFYRERRPPRKTLMQIIRELLERCPLLDPAAFVNVVMESNGYDLRKMDVARHLRSGYYNAARDDALRMLKVNSWAPRVHWDELSTRKPEVPTTGDDDMEQWPEIDTTPAQKALQLAIAKREKSLRCMSLALAAREYNEVWRLYEQELSDDGRPKSSNALEMALEASIRMEGGGLSRAKLMVEAARYTGFNVTPCTAPLLIHEMHHYRADSKRDFELIRKKVLDFYRANHESGGKAQLYVVTTAANILINSRQGVQAIQLLNSICRSKWAPKNPWNSTIMTVYLKGYATCRDWVGVQWVVKTLMQERLPVTRKFLYTLKYFCQKAFHTPSQPGKKNDTIRRLRQMQALLSQMRNKQKGEVYRVGLKLVDQLASSIKPALLADYRHWHAPRQQKRDKTPNIAI
jgi:hypothetical protein